MKGYYIEITNNLLDPKHFRNMKESVWLFMWCLDKMTSIGEDGIGKILGGKPIKPIEVYKELGISERTYWTWLARLKNKGYINTKRTSYGCVITVNKAKKRFGRSARSRTSEVQFPALTKKTVNSKTYTNAYNNFKELRDTKEIIKEKMSLK